MNIMRKKMKNLRNVRVRVNKNTSKEVKKSLKSSDFDKLLAACKHQNEVIDLFAFANKSTEECVQALVTTKLCSSEQSALERMNRHENNDIKSFISVRLARLFERANISQDVVQDVVTSE